VGADRLTALVDKQAAAGHTTTNRVEAHVDVDNVAEQRALEATGLRREGITAWRNGATAPITTASSTPSCATTHATQADRGWMAPHAR